MKTEELADSIVVEEFVEIIMDCVTADLIPVSLLKIILKRSSDKI